MDIHKQAAERMALRSPDPSTKVGCVIVQSSFLGYATVGAGWNDFPRGVPSYWWETRELKYRAVVHAEVRALLRAGPNADGATLYVTHHPCRDCAKMIAAAGIKAVVCPSKPWRDDPEVAQSCADAVQMLNLAGVEIIHAE